MGQDEAITANHVTGLLMIAGTTSSAIAQAGPPPGFEIRERRRARSNDLGDSAERQARARTGKRGPFER